MNDAPRVLALTVGLGVGGAERLLLLTAPALRARGYDVRVAALNGSMDLAGAFTRAAVPCLSFEARRRFDVTALARLAAYLRRERIDILHAHLFLANLAARLVGTLARTPVIVTAHHDTDVWMGPHHRLIERLSARLGDRVVACSDAVRRYAIERLGLPPGRVTTLRNAIAPAPLPTPEERARARRDLGFGPEARLIGTLGRLHEPKKGLRIFLAAAARLAAAEPRARFALIGDGPARPALERQAAALGIADRVRFIGTVPDPERFLPGLDLLVQPSLWEGFGLSVVEAMAAGIPVVASRIGGIPEAARDGLEAVLVPPGDAARLAEALLALLRDPERAGRLGAAGRRRALAEFGLDRLVGETEALYRELLPPRGAVAAAGRSAPGRAA